MSLWKKLLFYKYMCSPQICTQYKKDQRASFYICQKASFTVEASIIVPLCIGFLSCFLFFFRVIQVQTLVEETLIYVGRQVAVESSVIESKEGLFLSVEALFLNCLKDEPIIETYVKNAEMGICLLSSTFDGEEIVLHADYQMKLPVGFFEINSLSLSSENRFRKWTGNESAEEGGEWVYITPDGTAYHSSAKCQSLDLSIRRAMMEEIENLRGKNGQKYDACSRCLKEKRNGGYVYYTDYGRLYHKELSCSALKRTIHKIKKSMIGNRTPCKYCYE